VGPPRTHDHHSVWYSRILNRAGASAQLWAQRLTLATDSADAQRWETLDVVGWANESFQLTVAVVYGRLPSSRRIGDDYYLPALQVTEGQLQRAGVRLAHLLNRAAANSLSFSQADAPQVRHTLARISSP
jgi:hypothetical protein